MADASMDNSGGSGGGFDGMFDDRGDGDFLVTLEVEVRLDTQADDLDAYANRYCEAVRRNLDFWLVQNLIDQEGPVRSVVAADVLKQYDLTVECSEVRAGSVFLKFSITLRAWGKRAAKLIHLLAALSTIGMATAAGLQWMASDHEKAVDGFEQVVIMTAEDVGVAMTGKKPQVAPVGPTDTKPVMKS